MYENGYMYPLESNNAWVSSSHFINGLAKILTGRRYDLLHAWYALKSSAKGSIAFVIPTYSGQCWSEA